MPGDSGGHHWHPGQPFRSTRLKLQLAEAPMPAPRPTRTIGDAQEANHLCNTSILLKTPPKPTRALNEIAAAAQKLCLEPALKLLVMRTKPVSGSGRDGQPARRGTVCGSSLSWLGQSRLWPPWWSVRSVRLKARPRMGPSMRSFLYAIGAGAF